MKNLPTLKDDELEAARQLVIDARDAQASHGFIPPLPTHNKPPNVLHLLQKMGWVPFGTTTAQRDAFVARWKHLLEEQPAHG